MRPLCCCARVLFAVLLWSVVPAQATTLTFSTAASEYTPGSKNQGWWSNAPFDFGGDENENYMVGFLSAGTLELRAFFTFDSL